MNNFGKQLLRFGLWPALVYLGGFVLLTFPAIFTLSSRLWAGAGDGLVMVWNIWWVDKAITDLHQLPWHSSYVFHPGGASLFVHTQPFSGLLAIPLLRLFSLIETYNLIVIFCFVSTGVTILLAEYPGRVCLHVFQLSLRARPGTHVFDVHGMAAALCDVLVAPAQITTVEHGVGQRRGSVSGDSL
ncbi:MAG: hypothetical protein O3A51_01875 [Verrucomicrobia bacterium]|nr:hypothetical protein [Verrucomicrobiota bacterium]